MTSTISKWTSSGDFAQADARPRILFLHGYGSDEQDLPPILEMMGLNLPWASLRAPIRLPYGGNAWYELTSLGNPPLEPLTEATDAIWQWVDEHIPAGTSLIPIGFSQGGLMASQLLRTQPNRLMKTVVLSGFVTADEQPADARLKTLRPKVFWGRGLADTVIPEDAIDRTLQFLPKHSSLTMREYQDLAHSLHKQELDDLSDFLTR